MARRVLAALSPAAFLVAMSFMVAPAAAESGAAQAGERVLFVRGASVLDVAATGKGAPRELAHLPAGAADITHMQGARDGTVVLLQSASGGRAYWFDLRAEATPEAEPVECPGQVDLAPSGRCLVCAVSPETARVVRLGSGRGRNYAMPSGSLGFLGPAGRELVAAGNDGIWAYPLRRHARPRRLAPHRPTRALAPSPDGKRAVAVFPLEDATALESFRLDGRAARRTLMRDAEPVAWSASSKWLLVDQGTKACIVRATGGEYKCWRGFAGAAIAADGSYAILTKPAEPQHHDKKGTRGTSFDLYRAELVGADVHRPRLLVEGASSAAAVILVLPR